MDRATSERWVVISAFVVAGVYAYRRVTETATGPISAKKLIGLGNPVPLGAFATAWGVTYLIVSILASASPGLGGSFAILIATGDLLTNTAAIVGDVHQQETVQSAVKGTAQTTAASVNHAASSIGFLPHQQPARKVGKR